VEIKINDDDRNTRPSARKRNVIIVIGWSAAASRSAVSYRSIIKSLSRQRRSERRREAVSFDGETRESSARSSDETEFNTRPRDTAETTIPELFSVPFVRRVFNDYSTDTFLTCAAARFRDNKRIARFGTSLRRAR